MPTILLLFALNIPMPECHTWPQGLVFAGGIVYNIEGCPMPRIDGQCKPYEIGTCYENPPQFYFTAQFTAQNEIRQDGESDNPIHF